MSFENIVGSTVKNLGSGGSVMDGTIIGTATINTGGGKFGSNALSIASGTVTSGYVVISNSVVPLNVSGTWTVGMWIKTATAGGVYAYQGDGSWVSGNTVFHLNNGSTDTAGSQAGGVRYAQGWERGTATLTDNAWHFVVMTCNAGTKASYVDGALDAWTSGQDQWSGSGTGGQFWIGGTPNTGDGDVALNGLIDEVYVYDRALTPAEIQLLYGANKMQPLPATTPVSVASGAIFDLTGISQTIASLSGAGRVTNSAGQAVTLTLSNNTGTATFSGSITDLAASNSVGLIQSGAGTNVFSSANTYRGTTTIRGGLFLVNGSLGTNAVTVTNGGTLGGNGVINGAVTVQNNGILSPGSGIGKLTASSVVLQPGSATLMEISKSPLTNDQLRVTGALTCSGTLAVTSLSGTLAANDSFQLFNTGSTSGTFVATNLPPLNAGLGWNFNNASGILSVIQIVATNATNITYTVGSGNITLSWPADHTGWRLLMQTNNLATGLSANTNDWSTVANSQPTNQIVLPIDPTLSAEFYRLIYP
jgi:autotransporter-associated beta strand protein